MKVHVRHMLDSVAQILGKRKLDERDRLHVGVYKYSIEELSRHLEQLGLGEVTLDEFCEHYCLKRPAPPIDPEREDRALLCMVANGLCSREEAEQSRIDRLANPTSGQNPR